MRRDTFDTPVATRVPVATTSIPSHYLDFRMESKPSDRREKTRYSIRVKMFARTRDKAPFATVPPRSMRRQLPLSPVWTTKVDSPSRRFASTAARAGARAQRTGPQAAEPKRVQTAYNDESTPDWKIARTKFRAAARLSDERDRDHSRPHRRGRSTRARRIDEGAAAGRSELVQTFRTGRPQGCDGDHTGG
jgi:hypothetical protein